jgi:probable phosphoglycerate mutase
LSERGIAQAQALARRLASMGVAAILASDLPRARHTAEIIKAATGAPIETTELLRERNFGDWRGRPYDALPPNRLLMAEAPPGGESGAEFEARVAQAFALVVQRAAGTSGALAVVSHGLAVGAMLASHITLPSGMAQPAHLGNTCLTIFDAAHPHLASLVNSTVHLVDGARDDLRALSGG